MTITVRELIWSGRCAIWMLRLRSSAKTVSLWTRSPRMVSGSRLAVSSAGAMASRTPKHMPRCSALMIFIRRRRINFVLQSVDCEGRNPFKKKITSAWFVRGICSSRSM